ncbi:hypothetical protein K466DRAFT_501216, partial [Polyporus arcularius HHB13444]
LMSDGADCSIWMGFTQFIKQYLPGARAISEEKAQEVQDAFNKALGLTRGRDGRMVKKDGTLTEKEWSKAWETVANDETLPIELCPGFILHLSEDESDSGDTTKLRIDGSLISKSDEARIKGGKEGNKPNWSLQRLPIEFKRGGTSNDPFDDNPTHKHESDSVDRKGVYGQLMSYAERVFVHRHRKHLFFLFVNGPEFRVMFFDHGGVIATEAIDYISFVEGTAALLTFLHAFHELEAGPQGIDTTAALLAPTSCGYRRMDELKTAHPKDLAHHARYIDDASTIPEPFLDSSNPSAAFDATECGDPEKQCQGRRCQHKGPDALPVFTYVRDAFRESLEYDAPRYMIKVGEHRYLIGNCVNDPPTSLVGRGTKGYVALEWETQRFVFLKDTWRSYYVDIKPEGEILQELNKHGVRNVPTVIAHGDVEGQETETTNYSPITGEKTVEACVPYLKSVQEKKKVERRAVTKVGRMKKNAASTHGTPADTSEDSKGGGGTKRTADERTAEDNLQQGQGLRHLIHYRLVLREVCLPLTEVTSSKQLVILIIDSIVAHETAYKSCNSVHRDVSFGNMLICPSVKEYAVVWKGLLADWELAKVWTVTRALQPERTGTWHFMSRHILTHANQIVTIPDELESFVHVLIYAAVRLVHHNISDIRGFINYYFDGYVLTEDGYGCPAGKRICITEAKLDDSEKDILFRAENTEPADHPLNALVHELLALIGTRYTVLEWERAASKSEKRVVSSPTPSPDMTMQWDNYADLNSDNEEETESVDGDMDFDESSGKGLARQTTGEGRTQRPPSPATIASAKSLEKHSTIRLLLQRYLDKYTWPANDRVRDRLEKYTPRPRDSLSEVEDSNRKKTRTDSGPKPAAASSYKKRGRKTTSRSTRQKTSSCESLSGQDNQGTGASSSLPVASSSGGTRVTRSTSRVKNNDPGPIVPRTGPSSASSGPSGHPSVSVGQRKPKVTRTYSTRPKRAGRR